jgi:hypothetical protein
MKIKLNMKKEEKEQIPEEDLMERNEAAREQV